MAGSLGIFIDEKVIKYAKLKKDKDVIKVESFSVEFYEKENLISSIKKIISETNSEHDQINVNVSNEIYNYFEAFSMLEKKDIKDSVQIDFELLCGEKGYNAKALDTRYILTASKENSDKYKVLHVAVNKDDLNNLTKTFTGYKIGSITPVSTSVSNLIDIKDNESVVIVNIESQTQITSIVEGQIYRVDVISSGMDQILKEIAKTENSYRKSYAVCKNVTVYSQGNSLGAGQPGNEYANDVSPVLDTIGRELKEIIESLLTNVDKVYITGSGTIINNVDLYLQEYIPNIDCELLKPYFLETNSLKVPLKEYIEVNSAIALALNGMGLLNKEVNFGVKPPVEIDIKGLLSKIGIKSKKTDSEGEETGVSVSEKLLIRICVVFLVMIVGYASMSLYTTKKIDEKNAKVISATQASEVEIEKIKAQEQFIDDKTANYNMRLESLRKLAEQIQGGDSNRVIARDALPNMLSQVMFNCPQDVKLVSITNPNDKHFVIVADSRRYEQLGYLMSSLRTKGVLVNVQSTSGVKTDDIIEVTIEGDLP